MAKDNINMENNNTETLNMDKSKPWGRPTKTSDNKQSENTETNTPDKYKSNKNKNN